MLIIESPYSGIFYAVFVAQVNVQSKRVFSRGSQPEEFYKKNVANYFTKLTGKHLYMSLFLCCGPAALLQKRLLYNWFPVNFGKFIRTTFYISPVNSRCWLDKYHATLTIIFDFIENNWYFGVWSNLETVFREWFCLGKLFL